MASYIQPGFESDSQLLNTNMETISHELSSLLIGGELDSLGAIGFATTTSNGDAGGLSMSYVESCVTQLKNKCLKGEKNFDNMSLAKVEIVPQTMSTREANVLQLYHQYHYHRQLQKQQMQRQQQIQQQRTGNMVSNIYVSGPTSYPVGAAHLQSSITHDTNAFKSCVNYNNISVTTVPNQRALHSSVSDFPPDVEYFPKASTAPKFEFHFLRNQHYNQLQSDTSTVPLISSALFNDSEADFHCAGRRNTNGTVNKVNGSGQRKFSRRNDNLKVHNINYDNIVVDLSLLGLPLDNMEPNPVLRLFSLLRKMHYYMNDNLPLNDDIELHAAKISIDVQAKVAMPCTMNVQYQVKQAARKCTIFLCDMQRILNANKMYSNELYMECEQSSNKLRQLLTKLETFKRIELEHKRGQFVTEEARSQTQVLEQLLLQLNNQIRELHLYVHAFDWAVERTKRSTTYNAAIKLELLNPKTNDFLVNGEVAKSTTFTSLNRDIVGNVTSVSQRFSERKTTSMGETYTSGEGAVTNILNETLANRRATRNIGAV